MDKAHKKVLLTINDRATGILKLAYLKSKEAKEAKEIELKIIEVLAPWNPLIQIITSDNDKEFFNDKAIAQELNINF